MDETNNIKVDFQNNVGILKDLLQNMEQINTEKPNDKNAKLENLNKKFQITTLETINLVDKLFKRIEAYIIELPTEQKVNELTNQIENKINKITQLKLIDLEKRIQAYDELLDTQASKIVDLENDAGADLMRIQKLETLVDELKKTNQNTRNHINPTNIIQMNTQKSCPTFKANYFDKPIKFLKELRLYLEYLDPTEIELKIILNQSLKENANSWWNIVNENIHDYEDFEREFLNKYWNNSTRHNLRKKIEFGQYRNSKLSRVQYVTNLISISKDLNLNDKETLLQIKKHFDREIRCNLTHEICNSINAFLEVLEDFDNEDRMNKNRNHNSNINKDKIINKEKNKNFKNDKKPNNYERRDKNQSINLIDYDRIETVQIHEEPSKNA